jgi:hypothetical protein
MSITKTFGEFTVYEEYTDKEKESAVNIKVSINYKNKTYDISPPHMKTFTFNDGTKNGAKWKTIAQCIIKAVDFAEEQLK